MSSPNIEAMPAGVQHFNGASEPCDMKRGPCLCGAWHRITDWVIDQDLIVGCTCHGLGKQRGTAPGEGQR